MPSAQSDHRPAESGLGSGHHLHPDAPGFVYLALGLQEDERRAAYRELFRYELEPKLVDEIRQATNGNFVLGDNHFAAEVERMLGRRVARGKPGRPFKKPLPPPVSGELFA